MKNRHPCYLLFALLLALFVLGSGILPHRPSKASSPLCELEEDCFEEYMQDSLESCIQVFVDVFDVDGCGLGSGRLLGCPQALAGVCTFSPSLCSFGWMLPLRL